MQAIVIDNANRSAKMSPGGRKCEHTTSLICGHVGLREAAARSPKKHSETVPQHVNENRPFQILRYGIAGKVTANGDFAVVIGVLIVIIWPCHVVGR
jgi:hypothetical protein